MDAANFEKLGGLNTTPGSHPQNKMLSRTAASVRVLASLQPRSSLTMSMAFARVARPATGTSTFAARNPLQSSRFARLQIRLLSQETRQAIDKAVGSAPVVLFMKGTPETPQCGFSRASIQILGLQGVDPSKFTAFNVLEDEELRQGA